jgi:lysophospholipase L1-like esterase
MKRSSKRPDLNRFLQALLKVNWHIVLAIGVALFLILLVIRFYTYGRIIDKEEISNIPDTELDDDLDLYYPLMVDDDVTLPPDDGITTIVAFGNSPFADDRQSDDNLANLIAAENDAVVYNCSVGDSFLAAVNPTLIIDSYPMDAFNFYWLTTLITMPDITNINYLKTIEVMGENMPEDAREVYDTLSTLDFQTVDVITIMYDASDYLEGHGMFNDENPTDIQTFTGNLEAGIELLKSAFPHIRIIVMSPPYAFALDEDGNYVSSDIQRYGQDVLSTYVIRQGFIAYDNGLTFIDNLYGTFNEDNAAEYLTDNLHLNIAGRKLVARRFTEALHYFD